MFEPPQSPRKRYALGLTDRGCSQHPFPSESARYEFLGEQDSTFDDWYTLDVFEDGGIDFNLAPTGDDALDNLGVDP